MKEDRVLPQKNRLNCRHRWIFVALILLVLSCLTLTAEKQSKKWMPAEVIPGPDRHPPPISLLRWELLGLDDEAKDFRNPVRLSTILNKSSNSN